MAGTTKRLTQARRVYKGQHRFEHWYLDNQVYFITARVRHQQLIFTDRINREIFWRQFEKYATQHGFTPWVTSLIGNHYHTLGYLKRGDDLPHLMRLFHGYVAKLVNDRLPTRFLPFWSDGGHQNYFDGCIRNETQARRAHRYTLTQPARHRIPVRPSDYTLVRANVSIDRAVRRALELDAFLNKIPYKRFER